MNSNKIDDPLGSDGEEEALALSGSSNPDDEVLGDNQLEFDMWPGQFSLASVLPAARQAPWFSTSDLNEAQPTFDTYLAGNLSGDTLLLGGGSLPKAAEAKSQPPTRMVRSLVHMPSFMSETLEEHIQSEIESLLNDLDNPYEDVPTRNRVMSFGQGSPLTRRKYTRRISDFHLYSSRQNPSPGLLHLSDEENSEDIKKRSVQTLQDQVSQLAESQANTDDRYSKVRQENIGLNQRIHILEEQLREMDHRAGEQLADEQKRNRDIIARMEREKQLEIENYSIRFQTMERDLNSSMSEIHNLKTQNDRLKLEKNALEQELFETQQTLLQTQTEFSKMQDNSRRELGLVIEERKMNEHIVEELSKELESLKSASFPRGVIPSSLGVDFSNNSSPSSLMDEASGAGLNATTHINDLEDEIRALREKNKKLRESNDNLEAALINRSLQQGQEVLSKTKREGTSIADELEMDDSQLRSALKEQQEVNAQLRGYIDGILMNIIDKYPELLEVRK